VNTITKQELEKAGRELGGFEKGPPRQQEAREDPNETVLVRNNPDLRSEERQLAPLFLPDVAKEFRARWDAVQRGFVDGPRDAVRRADELVVQVMKSLAEIFPNEGATLEPGESNRRGVHGDLAHCSETLSVVF
jgi:hypothetical protein